MDPKRLQISEHRLAAARKRLADARKRAACDGDSACKGCERRCRKEPEVVVLSPVDLLGIASSAAPSFGGIAGQIMC